LGLWETKPVVFTTTAPNLLKMIVDGANLDFSSRTAQSWIRGNITENHNLQQWHIPENWPIKRAFHHPEKPFRLYTWDKHTDL